MRFHGPVGPETICNHSGCHIMANSFLSAAALSLKKEETAKAEPSESKKDEDAEQKNLFGASKKMATDMEKKLKQLPAGDLSLCRETRSE